MAGRKSSLLKIALLGAVALLPIIFSGCFSSDQNTFAPAGEVAKDQKNLFLLVMWPALAIMIIVEGLIVYAAIRFRRRSENEMPAQVHGNTKLELAWTIAPALLLVVIAVPTLDGIFKLGREAKAGALNVTVTGQQWSWAFEYPDIKDADGNPILLSGVPGEPAQLHVPVGREVGLALVSNDVIHSFWVPKLAGKQDVVPGRRNHMWFKADEPGTFRGQCAEFCGLDHSVMRLEVIAQTPEDFEAWVAEQQSGAASARGH